MTVLLLFAFNLLQTKAETEETSPPAISSEVAISEEVVQLLARYDEIKAMDKSTLSPLERKKLNK